MDPQASSRDGETFSDLVDVDQRGDILVLTLQRSHKRNALNAELIAQLTARVRTADNSPQVRALVIHGHDGVFSAGADLQEALMVQTPQAFHAFWAAGWELTAAITESSCPIVAAIEGACMTGGLELALACDFRVAAASASFAITSARIGSVAGFGGTQRLPKVIGTSRAKLMLFSGAPIDAATALDWGLIDVCVPQGEALEAAVALAASFTASAQSSVAFAKRAVNFGAGGPERGLFELERALCGWAFATPERAEGMRAFLDRRPPSLQGEDKLSHDESEVT